MTINRDNIAQGVIFPNDPAISTYTILKDFDSTNGGVAFGSLIQASDGNLYGTTRQGGITDLGVIFSYDPAASTYTKLRDFGTNNTGNSVLGALIKDQSKKLYGMTYKGGSYGATILLI